MEGWVALALAVAGIVLFLYSRKDNGNNSRQAGASGRAESRRSAEEIFNEVEHTANYRQTYERTPAASNRSSRNVPPRAPNNVENGGNPPPVRAQVTPNRPADITETGEMIYFANGGNQRENEYRFNFKKVNGSWRAYILKTPSFGRRDQSGAVTHRLYDERNAPYVCWDSPIYALKDMQSVARVWADSIQEYIATGTTFG